MKWLIFLLLFSTIIFNRSVLAQSLDEPDPIDASVPIFKLPIPPPVFDLGGSDTGGQIEVLAGATFAAAGMEPAQTASTFYWPFAVNITGQIVNYPDSGWTRNLLGITACPTKASRGYFGVPYCYAGNQGMELNLPILGTPIYAARSGVIEEVRNICMHTGIVLMQPINCPSGGTLSWEFGNFLRMRHDDGSQSIYAHLTKDSMLFPSATRIEVGTQIATVGNTGNVAQPALYFEIRSQSNVWMDPFGSGLWVVHNGVIVAAPSAFTGNPNTRVATLTDDNAFHVSEGGLNAEGLLQSSVAGMFQLAGNRMGVMDTAGNALYIKEGKLNSGWKLVPPGEGKIVAFQLAGDRIAVMDENNKFYVKYGAINGKWVLESGNIMAFQATDNRLGVIDAGEDLYVKDSTSWQLLQENVSAFQLNGDRIGVLMPNGDFYVKEGALGTAWVMQANNVQSFELEGTRIAYIDTANRLFAKTGALNKAFILIRSSVVEVQMENDRIVALQRNHGLYSQQGAISFTNWTLESHTAVAFKIYGNRTAVLDTANGFYIREGPGIYQLVRADVVDFDIGNRKTRMVKPAVTNQMALISPLGIVPNSHGHPVYEWNHVRGARYYKIYVAPADDLLNPKFYRAVPTIAFCNPERCSVDLTQLSPLAWLAEDTYELYIKPGNGGWFNIANPLHFTVQEPQPQAPTLGSTTNTNTLRPIVNWTLPETAVNSAWYEVYVAPSTDLFHPVFFKWIQREVVCGSRDGTSCQVEMDVDLIKGLQYAVYIHSWGPGGFSTGGNVPEIDGWVTGQFFVSQP